MSQHSMYSNIKTANTEDFSNLSGKLAEKLKLDVESETQICEKEFRDTFKEIVTRIKDVNRNELVGMEQTTDWMETVLNYNLLGDEDSKICEKSSGMLVPILYQAMMKSQGGNISKETIKLSYILGWCVAMLEAAFEIADNMMDDQDTMQDRKPAFHSLPNVGLSALNDSLMLSHLVYHTVKIYFFGMPENIRHSISDAFMITTRELGWGRVLYQKLSKEETVEGEILHKLHFDMVRYKNTGHKFLLPLKLACILVRADEKVEKCKIKGIECKLREIFTEIGSYAKGQKEIATMSGLECKAVDFDQFEENLLEKILQKVECIQNDTGFPADVLLNLLNK